MKWKITLLVGIVAFMGIFLYKEYNKADAYPLPDETQLESLINNEDTTVKVEDTNQKGVGISIGQTPPDIQLTTLEGEPFSLHEYKGKTVILNFWATWCPPCRAEMPDMQKFHDKHKNEGVEIVAVNLTSAERNQEIVQKFIDEFKIDFTIPLDESGNVGYQFETFSIPTSYIIDSDGVIQQKVIGPMTYEFMKNEVLKLQ